MTPDPAHTARPPERRPAVWPWLLVPLVTLAMFFTLRSFRTTTAPLPEPGAQVESAAPAPAR